MALKAAFPKRNISAIATGSVGVALSMTSKKGKIEKVTYLAVRVQDGEVSYFSRDDKEDIEEVINGDDARYPCENLEEFIGDMEEE
jgi:hypothetical protein